MTHFGCLSVSDIHCNEHCVRLPCAIVAGCSALILCSHQLRSPGAMLLGIFAMAGVWYQVANGQPNPPRKLTWLLLVCSHLRHDLFLSY